MRMDAQCFAGYNDSIDSLTVYFTSTSSGSYNYIAYDYGDGNWSQNVEDPIYTYSSPGIYEVCQWVEDTISFTCFDYSCDTLYIGDATCNADYYWFPDGLDVEFYLWSLGTYDSLVWDFGDGSISNDTAPIHSYSSAGTYTVCLSLYDSTELCDSTCYQITVDSNSCEADFSYTINNLDITLSNLSSGGFNAVEWDFGDGFGFSTQFNPSYSYFLAGTYEVCLYVYDSLNFTCYDEYCVELTVTTGGGGGGGCDADFDYEAVELDLEVTNTSGGTFLTEFWDYGDGSGISFDTEHTYDEPGLYDVCLTIGNLIPFCLDEYCQEVQIVQYTCETDFTFSFNESNVYSFTNTTQGTYDAVLWEFGDGNSSTFANPSYTYNVPGTYEACLTTYVDGNPCGVTCKEMDVYPAGLNKVSAEDFRTYPNPSDGSFTIELPIEFLNKNVRVEFSGISGRLVHQEMASSNNGIINLDLNLTSGMYLLKVSSQGRELVRPVMIR